MRIISDFKDYYDSIMGTGQDRTLVYKRYRQSIDIDPGCFCGPFSSGPYGAGWNEFFTTDQYLIWFCGKTYPLVAFEVPLPGKTVKAATYCYRTEDVDSFVRRCYPKSWEHYATVGYVRKNLWPRLLQRHMFVQFFDAPLLQSERMRAMAEEKRCPVVVAHGVQRHRGKPGTLTLNAELKRLEFIRMFDPYSAFQEIAMWLGNQAEPRKPIPEIGDETMAEIKGFDKWSFRKPPKNRQ